MMSNQPTKLDISTPKHPNSYTIIDSNMFEELNKYKWCKVNGYCLRSKKENKKSSSLLIHRVIMKAKSNEQVDHRDGDPMNNQRSNLRICTSQQNNFNKNLGSNNTSGFKGIEYRRDRLIWRAQIELNSKKLHLGHYQSKEQAAAAYNFAAKYLFKDFAKINQISISSQIENQIKEKVKKHLAKHNLIF